MLQKYKLGCSLPFLNVKHKAFKVALQSPRAVTYLLPAGPADCPGLASHRLDENMKLVREALILNFCVSLTMSLLTKKYLKKSRTKE